MICAFVMNRKDNVATLLDDCTKGSIVKLVGDVNGSSVVVLEDVAKNHKVTLIDIFEKQPVIKGGVSIGIASTSVKAGSWLHMHNCSSRYDLRHYEKEVRGASEGQAL